MPSWERTEPVQSRKGGLFIPRKELLRTTKENPGNAMQMVKGQDEGVTEATERMKRHT
jgi:hypothetical protein